jgi:hypothetical protein
MPKKSSNSSSSSSNSDQQTQSSTSWSSTYPNKTNIFGGVRPEIASNGGDFYFCLGLGLGFNPESWRKN